MFNISHGTKATQVCRVFYQLATGKLINPQRSSEMLADLADPKLHHKFVSQLDERAPKANLFRKSGTWKQWQAVGRILRTTNKGVSISPCAPYNQSPTGAVGLFGSALAGLGWSKRAQHT